MRKRELAAAVHVHSFAKMLEVAEGIWAASVAAGARLPRSHAISTTHELSVRLP